MKLQELRSSPQLNWRQRNRTQKKKKRRKDAIAYIDLYSKRKKKAYDQNKQKHMLSLKKKFFFLNPTASDINNPVATQGGFIKIDY